jgi:hypothetical protein
MMLGTEEPFSAAAAAVLPVSFLASVVTVSCMTKSCLVLPLFCFVDRGFGEKAERFCFEGFVFGLMTAFSSFFLLGRSICGLFCPRPELHP